MKRNLLFLGLLLACTVSVKAQNYTYFTEYFDDANATAAISGTSSTPTTGPTNAALSSGTWEVYYVYRAGGTCLTAPSSSSGKSVRIVKTSFSGLPAGTFSYAATPTLPYGVNTVGFRNAKTGGSINVYTSTNNGTSWTLAQTVAATSTACDTFTVTINNASVNRVKFQNETTSDQDIDGVTITSVNPILPVTIFGAKAFTKENGVQLEWNVGIEDNVASYIIERAINSRDFAAITTVAARGNSNYAAFDANPVAGVNYYRIKTLDKDGSFKYSSILTVNISKAKAEVVVAPNPVKGGQLNLQIGGLEKGSYSLRLYNDLGQEVFSSQISTTGGSLSQSFTLPSNVKAGMYNLQLNGGEVKISKRVVIQ